MDIEAILIQILRDTCMVNKLRVGIAGFGVVGKRRRDAIDRHPQMITTAVCDVTFPQSGTTSGDLKCFHHYKELLNEELDILFVCLPNYLAAEVTIAGLERGLHVFCEKPPGRDVADIEKVIVAEKKCPKQVLMYGFNHRYHESIREALKVIKSGDLGYLINARGIYGKSMIIPFSGGWRAERAQSGGGILLDQGIHMVDLMRLFCGEFTQVYSFVNNAFWKHDVEDNAYALMRTDSGVIGMIHSSATEWRHRFRLELSFRNFKRN
jgi:predicted dehydrogenase